MTIFTDNDPELDALLSAADPIDPTAVRSAAASSGAAALRLATTAAPGAKQRRYRALRPVLLAAAVAAAVPLALSQAGGSSHASHPSSSGGGKYDAQLVSFANNSPRLLLGADGWRVTRADEQDAQNGEMTFASGTRSLDLHWVAGVHSKDTDEVDMTPVGSAQIDGAQAWVGAYSAHEFEAIWSVGDQALDARGVFDSKAAFLDVAATLHEVDANTWLDAMPASVIEPSGRAATVEKMLAGIPQPPGFAVAALDGSAQVSDRYQLGAKVSGSVTCGWLHLWTHGTAAERSRAAAAMAGSRDWAILQEMQADGAYPEVVWQVADAMNGKSFDTGGESLEEWSKSALGC